MKTRLISPSHTILSLFSFLGVLLLLVFVVQAFRGNDFARAPYVLISVIALAVVAFSWSRTAPCDSMIGLFSAGMDGVVVRTIFKRRTFTWGSFVEGGIITANLGVQKVMLVYFSTRSLSENDRADFFKCVRNDRGHVAFFECHGAYLRAILPYVPAPIAASLKEQMEQRGLFYTN